MTRAPVAPGAVFVRHGTCSVPVAAPVAWAFDLEEGAAVTDADLAAFAACAVGVGRATRRLRLIVGVAGMIGRHGRAQAAGGVAR